MKDMLIFIILNLTFVLLFSPFYMGIIKKVKAYAQGRRGPPLLQPYYNILKLLKKETVYSTNSSYIMRIAPIINMGFMLAAALCVPLFFIPETTIIFGSVILFVYLMAFAKFFMALAGLDAGSTFGGMGSSREMSLSAVFEPIIIIVFATLAFIFKSTSFFDIFSAAALPTPATILISISIFIIIIVETSRIPVDNPETHLELTMVHEAMILEQSGRNLAMMEWSHAIKQMALMAVLINILFPLGNISATLSIIGIGIAAIIFLLKAGVLSIIIGISESSVAKYRLFRVPNLFMIAFFFSLMTMIIEVLL